MLANLHADILCNKLTIENLIVVIIKLINDVDGDDYGDLLLLIR